MLAIGGTPVDTLDARVQRVIPQAENEQVRMHRSAAALANADVLSALGGVPPSEPARFAFAADDGSRFELAIPIVAPPTRIDWVDVASQAPPHLQHPEVPFWFEHLPRRRAVYVSFRRYQGRERNALALSAFLDGHRDVDTQVVGRRHNGGGNDALGRQHLIYPLQMRPALNRTGRLFVATGRETFSAGMTNAIDFRRETDALLVGEPVGARPRGDQENGGSTLRDSGLRLSTSSPYDAFKDDDSPTVMPDQLVPPDWDTYRAGRDPVPEWILREGARAARKP